MRLQGLPPFIHYQMTQFSKSHFEELSRFSRGIIMPLRMRNRFLYPNHHRPR